MLRRDFLTFASGSAVGLVFTPVPWTLLNDASKWSQNWSWIPRPQSGEVRTKFTTCTLCPAGCGVRARSIGDQPVSLAGVPAHPGSCGALCPIGLAGHQQAYHPGRLRQPLYRGRPVPIERAVADVRAAIDRSAGKGCIAVFDAHPGHAGSVLYQRFAARFDNGVYLAPAWSRRLDIDHTRTILSFNTPILDGWGTPGRVLRNRDHFRLVQMEPTCSRTASLADVWLPIRASTEAAMAFGLAHVLVQEKLYDTAATTYATDFREYLQLVEPYTPERVASICGIPAEDIIGTARDLVHDSPVLAVGEAEGEAQIAIAGLNLLCGNIRAALPGPAPSSLPPDGSIRVLIACGEPPWGQLANKLAADAVVVSLSPWDDRRATYVIPTPVYLESLQDVPEPPDAPGAMLSLSAPLVAAPAGVITPAAFLARLEPAIGTLESEIAARVRAVHQTGRGSVIRYQDGRAQPLAEIATAAELQKTLLAGAVWVDKSLSEAPVPRFALLGNGRPDPLATPYGWRAVKALSVSPILSKLYQESGLRDGKEA